MEGLWSCGKQEDFLISIFIIILSFSK